MPGRDWSGEWAAALSRSSYRAFPLDRSRLVRHWDRISSHYDSLVMEQIDQRLWELLVQDGAVPSPGKVLDIGCGTGAMTERFAVPKRWALTSPRECWAQLVSDARPCRTWI